MRKTSVIAALVLTAALPLTVLAQADSIYRPISASCVPGFSTNGWPGTNVTTHFSFNILGGANARVLGAEIGSILNINAKSMTGFQIGGVLNVTAGDVTGMQIGGVTNVVSGDLSVTHIAGVGNFAGGEVKGAQIGGVTNIAGGNVTGAQVSGVFNLAGGDLTGLQLGGTVNVSAGSASVQAGVINVGVGTNFTQLGVVNFAQEARGLQLGVVNVAVEQEGVPIGVVSVAGNGTYNLDLWVDGNALTNVAFKMGSKYIYNVYAYGYNPFNQDGGLNKFGLGLGTHVGGEGPLFADIDAIHHNVLPGVIPFLEQQTGYSGLTEVRFSGGVQITPRLAVTAGPTINIWHSDWLDGDYVHWGGLPIADLDEANYTDIWLGFGIGVQLF